MMTQKAQNSTYFVTQYFYNNVSLNMTLFNQNIINENKQIELLLNISFS